MQELGDPKFIPVIIAVGEICDRPDDPAEGLDSIELMYQSLVEAQDDAGTSLLDRLEWLGVEEQISFPTPTPQHDLAAYLPCRPDTLVKTAEASGNGPLQLINDAANLIGEGRIRLAAAVGGEALRTAAKRAQADIAAGREPPRNNIAAVAIANAKPLARKHKLFTPIDVYPLYENATRAAWGQTVAEAQCESAKIWSEFSKVAAANPKAWLRQPVEPDAIGEASADNRMLAFPYTKLMVANSSVNMGAAVIVASLAFARENGIPEERLVYVGRGAAAHENEDFLLRDGYSSSPSLETTVTEALGRNNLTATDIDMVELYSCFPCVPKMARRILDWPVDRPASVYGGLTFGGGPIGNCMMHAAARMVHRLRGEGGTGLIVANGGYATHNHCMVLTRTPKPAGTFPQDYSAQDIADSRRGAVPDLLEEYEGHGVIETFTMPYGHDGEPHHATVIARNDDGARFLATIPRDDRGMLHFLTGDAAIGSSGMAVRLGENVVWQRLAK